MDRNNASGRQETLADDLAPFGTRPRRPISTLCMISALLAAWIGVLVWMAANVGPHA